MVKWFEISSTKILCFFFELPFFLGRCDGLVEKIIKICKVIRNEWVNLKMFKNFFYNDF